MSGNTEQEIHVSRPHDPAARGPERIRDGRPG